MGLLKLTLHDNDFTAEIEEFAADLALTKFYCTTKLPEYQGWDTMKKMNKARELLYSTEKYTPELIAELEALIKEHWALFVTHIMKPHPWWSPEETPQIKEYLIQNFDCKFQKSLIPHWSNGEVVYVCLGYMNRWWTF